MICARATQADLAAIMALETDGFEHAGWSETAWREELDGADRYVLIARDAADQVIGVATFQATVDVADLHRVVVRSDRRSEGVGRRLVCAGIEWAQAMGAGQMLLEVDQDNAPARHLYTQLGFEPVARRRDYYGPGLHALVLSLALGADTEQIA